MSLDKAITYKKEKRKPYRKAKAISYDCRNHGVCNWCKTNRKWFDTRHRRIADEKIKEWEET